MLIGLRKQERFDPFSEIFRSCQKTYFPHEWIWLLTCRPAGHRGGGTRAKRDGDEYRGAPMRPMELARTKRHGLRTRRACHLLLLNSNFSPLSVSHRSSGTYHLLLTYDFNIQMIIHLLIDSHSTRTHLTDAPRI